jgi:hypothetical protein
MTSSRFPISPLPYRRRRRHGHARLHGKNLVARSHAIDNNQTHGIEKVDITGSGNNTLSLALERCARSLGHEQSTHDRRQRRGCAVPDGPGHGPDAWSAGSAAAGYRTYTADGATLLVDTDITVTNWLI